MTPIPGKKVDHQGIRVQLLGEIELAAERGHPHEFVSLGEPVALAEVPCQEVLQRGAMLGPVSPVPN